LYGPHGFYRTGSGPAAHFRTSVHASPLFAEAVAVLLREVDAALGHPAEICLVDMGAGRGELLEAVRAQCAEDSIAARLSLIGVDIAPRPDALADEIAWRGELPDTFTGLLIANEWLDNVPFDVAQMTPNGWRIVEVDQAGAERIGAAPSAEQSGWLAQWWPLTEHPDEPVPGRRAEIGVERDAAWRAAIGSISRGLAVAFDYSHSKADRPAFGTLTAYRAGRQCEPIPDGSCDITAHVALDSCAKAGSTADWTVLTNQRSLLQTLSVSGERPPLERAHTDPLGYLRALSRASAAAELTDLAGLGGFGCLIQSVGCPVPVPLRGLPRHEPAPK
jgi:SAM-dependent MidA family methyltransferase